MSYFFEGNTVFEHPTIRVEGSLLKPGIYKPEQLKIWKEYYDNATFRIVKDCDPKEYADTCLKDYLQKAKELKIYVEE